MADIGSTLREARIRARIDISEVETRTKIRAKYLRAMENEEWDLLPGPVYVKSFLRTYGEFLGLDTRTLVDDYKRRYERPADQDTRPISSLRRDRERHERGRRGPRLGPLGVVALALLAVVVALFVVGSLGKKASTTTPTTGASAPTTTHAHHPQHPGRVITHSPPPPPRTVTLKLVPTSTVYVCLENGKGKVLIPGVIFSAGQTVPVKTARKLLLTLGNNAVQMQVNGKTMPVAVGAPIGYELTPAKASRLLPGHLPTCT